MVNPEDIKWITTKFLQNQQKDIRNKHNISDNDFEENKQALKDFLCGYFNSNHNNYTKEQGKTISPINIRDITSQNSKVLKVRWNLPGKGKSGGLRLAILIKLNHNNIVYEVKICGAWVRKSDPSDEEINIAVLSD
jgi:hypothetical protein